MYVNTFVNKHKLQLTSDISPHSSTSPWKIGCFHKLPPLFHVYRSILQRNESGQNITSQSKLTEIKGLPIAMSKASLSLPFLSPLSLSLCLSLSLFMIQVLQ